MTDFEHTNLFILSNNKIYYDFGYINIKSSSKAFLSRVCLWHARSISCQVIFMLLQPILKLEYISCTMDSWFWLNLLRFIKIVSMCCMNIFNSMLKRITLKNIYVVEVRNNISKWEKCHQMIEANTFRESLWSALLSTFIVCKINSSFKLWYQLG